MKTYQDLMNVRESEAKTGLFLLDAVNEFKSSEEYRNAVDGMCYYNKHNITMERFQKFIYTISGNKIPDIFSANYKLKSMFFRRLVTQEVQYILGNGLLMGNKEKLGKDIDYKLQTAAKMALAQGAAFGYWNKDHLEVFSYADFNDIPGFVPLKDEKTSEMMAGIRYWFRAVNDGYVFRATLYEEDGVSEWAMASDEKDVKMIEDKRAYIIKRIRNDLGVIEQTDENYTKLPIAMLYGNDTHESELVGIRESIDCYDFIKSGLANQIDDTSGFYWILKNAGGMDDADLAQFVQRMKTIKATVIDSEDGATAEAHTLDVPVEARKTMLDILKRDIYEDFQMLDVQDISAASKTATEIQAAYQAQDNKCADFEYMLIEFIQNICEIAGLGDVEPKFVWNKIINKTEETNMVMAAANYLDEETIIKALPFIPTDDVEDILKRLSDADMQRMGTRTEKVILPEEVEEQEEEQTEE